MVLEWFGWKSRKTLFQQHLQRLFLSLLDNHLVHILLIFVSFISLDTLKVRLQVSAIQTGTQNFVHNIIKNDGILSLWRGATVAFLGQICENTTSFVLNAHFQRLLGFQEDGEISITRSFFVGSMAGLCTSIIICPIETVKCKVQVAQATTIADKRHCVKSIIREYFRSHGFRGLYYGIFPQMARDIHGSAIYFGCYDVLYHFFHNSMLMGTAESCIMAGGFAGQIYWFSSLPMDRVKSIIQTQRFDSIPGHTLRTTALTPLHGLIDGLKVTTILYQLHGIRGFYQGGIFALIRAFPTNASLFYGYKSARKFLDEMTG